MLSRHAPANGGALGPPAHISEDERATTKRRKEGNEERKVIEKAARRESVKERRGNRIRNTINKGSSGPLPRSIGT